MCIYIWNNVYDCPFAITYIQYISLLLYSISHPRFQQFPTWKSRLAGDSPVTPPDCHRVLWKILLAMAQQVCYTLICWQIITPKTMLLWSSVFDRASVNDGHVFLNSWLNCWSGTLFWTLSALAQSCSRYKRCRRWRGPVPMLASPWFLS